MHLPEKNSYHRGAGAATLVQRQTLYLGNWHATQQPDAPNRTTAGNRSIRDYFVVITPEILYGWYQGNVQFAGAEPVGKSTGKVKRQVALIC